MSIWWAKHSSKASVDITLYLYVVVNICLCYVYIVGLKRINIKNFTVLSNQLRFIMVKTGRVNRP
jgi:hypothetical protein